MQVYTKSNRLRVKTFLFLLLLAFVAYLPVSTFLFSLKNDAFTGYFPPKFFMSESIHAGYLPLWNPYLNFGFPLYGDMSGGYWSPVTWLIASTVGYNAYTFTIELLVYILIGGIGIYKLAGAFNLQLAVRTIAAVAFMCGGFNVGHMQHFNWVSGAAFLPWCFWSYHLLLHSASLKKILVGTCSFYLLISSAHPGISIAAVYFFAGYGLFYFFTKEALMPFRKKLQQFVTGHLLMLVVLALLAAGMIAGYADLMPHFVRGQKITIESSLTNPTSGASWISMLLPFATTKNEGLFQTDIAMRNCYFGITLLLFLLLNVINKKTALQKFLLVTGILFALLSAGGIFKIFAYNYLPLIGYVRLNGEFRIFALLCFILSSAIELDKYILQKQKFKGVIKWIYYATEVAVIVAIAFGIYKAVSSGQTVWHQTTLISAQPTAAMKLKVLIDAISFYDTLWMQGTIQLLLLWGIKWCLRFEKWSLLKKIAIVDLVLACLLNIPFTGVGKASVSQVQAILDKSPAGIPTPAMLPLIKNDSLSTTEKLMVGDWSFYSKQIGVVEQANYPMVLNTSRQYFEKDAITHKENSLAKPFVFSTSDQSIISVKSFSPQQIAVGIKSDTAAQLVLQQNYYPHWFYTNGTEKEPVNSYGITFMSAPIKKGENDVVFSFEPTVVKWAMLMSLVSFVAVCGLIVYLQIKSRKK